MNILSKILGKDREFNELLAWWCNSGMEAIRKARRVKEIWINTDGQLLFRGLLPMNVPSKIGRNSPCPCGSEKKYKKCCGRNK